MTDYAQVVRDRMAEIGRLPPPRHDILVPGPDLTVCRSVGRGPGNIVMYTYHLSPGCTHFDGYRETLDTIMESNVDDGAALLAFTNRMTAIARWLRREPVDPIRLKALARYAEENT